MDDGTELVRGWDAVATAWDAHVDEIDVHSTDATAALLRRVNAASGDHVLELAAGPGSLAATWSGLVGPTGRVVLSDVAPAMVAVAQRRSATLGNVDTAVLDAMAVDAPDESFDVVACRMGLMFVPDPAVALAEIRRVLRAGGRFGALTWGGLEHNPWMTCVGMAAMMHGIVTGGPPVGPGGVFSLSDPARLLQLATDAGFGDVRVDECAVTFRAPTIEEHIDRVASLAGPLAVALQQAAPEARAAFHRTATELAAAHLTDEGLVIPGRALLVSGSRT